MYRARRNPRRGRGQGVTQALRSEGATYLVLFKFADTVSRLRIQRSRESNAALKLTAGTNETTVVSRKAPAGQKRTALYREPLFKKKHDTHSRAFVTEQYELALRVS